MTGLPPPLDEDRGLGPQGSLQDRGLGWGQVRVQARTEGAGFWWEPRGCWHFHCGNKPFLPVPAWPSDVEAIARLIATFLELHRLESPVELSQSSDSETDSPGSQS